MNYRNSFVVMIVTVLLLTTVATLTQPQAVTATFKLNSPNVCIPVSGVSFTYTPLTPRIRESLTFTGTVGDGTPPITYAWNWGDGTVAGAGTNPTHTFPVTSTTQTYTVTLTASNTCYGSVPVSVVQLVTVRALHIYLSLLQK